MGLQDDMLSVLAGPGRTQPRPPQVTGPVVGIARSASADGVMFTIPFFDGGKYVYGPAKWDKGGAVPTVGAECLILFGPLGFRDPWIIAWWT